MGDVVPFLRLSPESRRILDELSRKRGQSPVEILEELIRRADQEEHTKVSEDEPVLVLEAIEEVPAIGPEGRGKRVHFKAIDETGEWDAGEMFVPDKNKP